MNRFQEIVAGFRQPDLTEGKLHAVENDQGVLGDDLPDTVGPDVDDPRWVDPIGLEDEGSYMPQDGLLGGSLGLGTTEDTGVHSMSGISDALKLVENDAKAGQKKDGSWAPHTSAEGGTDTIGYGHKLTASEDKSGKISIGGSTYDVDNVPDDAIDTLLEEDIATKKKELAKTIKDWDKLDETHKDILTNIAFNIGTSGAKKFKKLLKAMVAGDETGVQKEMVTSYKDKKGVRHKLQKRADDVYSMLKG